MTSRDPQVTTQLKQLSTSGVPRMSSEQLSTLRERMVPRIAQQQALVLDEKKRTRSWKRVATWLAAAAIPLSLVGGYHGLTNARGAVGASAGRSDQARLSALEGLVTMELPGSSVTVPSGADVVLERGRAATTAASSRARLQMPSGARLLVDHDSKVVLDASEATLERVDLGAGQVEVEVPTLGPTRSLQIRTAEATVVVHGTRFVVREIAATDGGEGETQVEVTEGLVSADCRGVTTYLPAGSTWSSRQIATGQAPVVTPGTRASENEPAGTGATTASSSMPTPPSAAVAPTKTKTVGEREPEEPGSTLAIENALLQRAMSAARSGDDRRAVQLLDELLSRYPTSPLAQNAKVERMRAFARLGDQSALSRESRRYLAEHPDGFARDEARGGVLPSTPASASSAKK
jgi:hypothetical protein